MGAINDTDTIALCVDISRDVMSGAYYKALMQCKKLFEFEQERLNYEPKGLPEHAAHL
jgi:flagellar protein FlbT